MNWPKHLLTHIRSNEPLSAHTSLEVGGPAQVWVEPDSLAGLKAVVSDCAKGNIPYLVIGRGTNILFSDRGFKGVVICLSSASFSRIECCGSSLVSGAGLRLERMLNHAQKKGLLGLEFLAGIPATVAGAVVMNAGGRENNIGRRVKRVMVMDRSTKVRNLAGEQLRFAYRRSNLDKYIVLEAEFALEKDDPSGIKERMMHFLRQKRLTQDLSAKSAGCIFKNPAHRQTAGQMIEACGLKGRSRGGAEISVRHANYIINRDSAKAADILYLMKLAQTQVRKKFGVNLEPEIKIIP